jgi:flagellar biosynthetic protein FlhB
MSEDSDAEKTEPASARRLEKAREEGDVPRSREITTFTVLMMSGSGLWLWGDRIIDKISLALRGGLSFDRAQAFDMDVLLLRVESELVQILLACLPIGIAVMLVALASPLLIGGWLMSAQALQPNFGRMNPIKGLSNLVSKNAVVELIKAIGKTVLVGSIVWMVVKHYQESMFTLGLEPLKLGIMHIADLLTSAFLLITGGLAIIAGIDAPYQIWHYGDKLKMTRQEVIQEAKESDGNPQIKARIRQLQREMAKQRMMAAIPTADVVVTNPTHYAVALKYSEGKMRAPQVVAKGADEVAARIRELAIENKVAILEAPALARALHKHTDIGDEIPQALYTAVAEVLAYVFQLRTYKKRGGNRPDIPRKLDVPPELDPLNPASQKPEPTPPPAS